MNFVLSGRSSYEASIHVPLPANYHQRFAPSLLCAKAYKSTPDNHPPISYGGGATTPRVNAVPRFAEGPGAGRAVGRAHPSDRNLRLTAARPEPGIRPSQSFVIEFVHALRQRALPASALSGNRATDRIRAQFFIFSAGPVHRNQGPDFVSRLERPDRLRNL